MAQAVGWDLDEALKELHRLPKIRRAAAWVEGNQGRINVRHLPKIAIPTSVEQRFHLPRSSGAILSSRPRTTDGYSFTLVHSTITKGSRELSPAGFQTYVEGLVRQPSDLPPPPGAAGQTYLENGRVEWSDGSEASFGNIGITRAQRQEFWHAAEETERPGGIIQCRVIVSLPSEATSRQRLRIAYRVTDLIAAKGLPYWGVIHQPDKENDPRNYHLHLLYWNRPAKRLADGRWDFTVVEEYQSASRNWRRRYPHRQPKDRSVGAGTTFVRARGKLVKVDGWLHELRRHYAAVANSVLEQAGIDKRLTPAAYRDVGLDKTPTRRLGKRQAFLERVGVTTWTGASNYAAELDYLAKSTDPDLYDGIDAIRGLEDGLSRLKDDLAKVGLAIYGKDLDRAYAAYCAQLASYLDTLARAHTVDSWQRRESLRIAHRADAIAPGLVPPASERGKVELQLQRNAFTNLGQDVDPTRMREAAVARLPNSILATRAARRALDTATETARRQVAAGHRMLEENLTAIANTAVVLAAAAKQAAAQAAVARSLVDGEWTRICAKAHPDDDAVAYVTALKAAFLPLQTLATAAKTALGTIEIRVAGARGSTTRLSDEASLLKELTLLVRSIQGDDTVARIEARIRARENAEQARVDAHALAWEAAERRCLAEIIERQRKAEQLERNTVELWRYLALLENFARQAESRFTDAQEMLKTERARFFEPSASAAILGDETTYIDTLQTRLNFIEKPLRARQFAVQTLRERIRTARQSTDRLSVEGTLLASLPDAENGGRLDNWKQEVLLSGMRDTVATRLFDEQQKRQREKDERTADVLRIRALQRAAVGKIEQFQRAEEQAGRYCRRSYDKEYARVLARLRVGPAMPEVSDYLNAFSVLAGAADKLAKQASTTLAEAKGKLADIAPDEALPSDEKEILRMLSDMQDTLPAATTLDKNQFVIWADQLLHERQEEEQSAALVADLRMRQGHLIGRLKERATALQETAQHCSDVLEDAKRELTSVKQVGAGTEEEEELFDAIAVEATNAEAKMRSATDDAIRAQRLLARTAPAASSPSAEQEILASLEALASTLSEYSDFDWSCHSIVVDDLLVRLRHSTLTKLNTQRKSSVPEQLPRESEPEMHRPETIERPKPAPAEAPQHSHSGTRHSAAAIAPDAVRFPPHESPLQSDGKPKRSASTDAKVSAETTLVSTADLSRDKTEAERQRLADAAAKARIQVDRRRQRQADDPAAKPDADHQRRAHELVAKPEGDHQRQATEAVAKSERERQAAEAAAKDERERQAANPAPRTPPPPAPPAQQGSQAPARQEAKPSRQTQAVQAPSADFQQPSMGQFKGAEWVNGKAMSTQAREEYAAQLIACDRGVFLKKYRDTKAAIGSLEGEPVGVRQAEERNHLLKGMRSAIQWMEHVAPFQACNIAIKEGLEGDAWTTEQLVALAENRGFPGGDQHPLLAPHWKTIVQRQEDVRRQAEAHRLGSGTKRRRTQDVR